MGEVVEVKFKNCGKIYNYETDDLQIKKGDLVVVESDFGLNIGKVINKKESSPFDKGLRKVLRIASEEDIKVAEDNKALEKEAMEFCEERIMARGLQMKLVLAESTLDKKRLIFYFTADGRIDFRELVKDLAAKFKTRIEMRQIGVRDETKIIGGIGICGREVCCKTFLNTFEPVSIKMAKKQELSLNVSKLSGLCGRLMCCLRYEYDGDMEEITTDDEIPQEESSITEKEQKMVNVISVLEQRDADESEIPQEERQERFKRRRGRFRR